MKVATYLRARTLTLDARTENALRPGQVRIGVDFVGLCGVDLRIFGGRRDQQVGPFSIMGHEVSGRIEELGEGVTGLELGQMVTVIPASSCDSCPACTAGFGHLCHRLSLFGVDLPGGLQGSWVVPAHLVVAVPDGTSPQFAALIEPAALAIHALRRAPVRAGQRVVVTDGGPVGLFVALFAAHAGATVAVVERDRHRRIVGMTAGLHMLDPERDAIETYIQEWSKGAGVDTAFEISGEEVGVVIAVKSLATRGRLVLVGSHAGPASVSLNRIIQRELAVLGASMYERQDFEEAAALLADGFLPASLFISAVEPLRRINEAFGALEQGSVMKVLIGMRDEDADDEADPAEIVVS